MIEPAYRVLYYEDAKQEWIASFQPGAEAIALVDDWRYDVEEFGFDPGASRMDDDRFLAAVPGTRAVVAGLLMYERLLIVKEIRTIHAI